MNFERWQQVETLFQAALARAPATRAAFLAAACAEQRYERLSESGAFPVWLNDNRRLLFREAGDLYLLDRKGGAPQKIFSLKPPNQIGSHALLRDNRRLYFTDAGSEADIWLLKLEQRLTK